MSPQLAAYFAAHKTAILGAAAAGVAGLALLQRKKAGTTTATGTTAQPAGTIPAAAVVPSGAADSSAYDVYSALQSELGPMLQAQQANSVTTAPAPVASTLLSPTYDGNYFHMGSGLGEIESDGSLFVFNPQQWSTALQQDPAAPSKVNEFGSSNLPGVSLYSTTGNVAKKATGS